MYETPFKYVWLTFLGVKFYKSHCRNFYTCIHIYIYVYVYMYNINTYLDINTLFISTDLGTSKSLEKHLLLPKIIIQHLWFQKFRLERS